MRPDIIVEKFVDRDVFELLRAVKTPEHRIDSDVEWYEFKVADDADEYFDDCPEMMCCCRVFARLYPDD